MADDAAKLEFRGGTARLIAAMGRRAVMHHSGMRLPCRKVRLRSPRHRRPVAGEAEQENSGHE
jgi:hypothetical protein